MRRGKADRFYRVAKKELKAPWVMNEARLAMILRREHRTVVRMVKAYKELCRPHDSDRCVEYLEAWHHIENTCDDILARLNARAR